MRIVEMAEAGEGFPVVRDGIALPVGVTLSDRPVGAITRDVDGGLRSFEVTSTVQLDGREGRLLMWVFFSKRRSITTDAFVAHWRDVHAPLAREHHVGMCRYVQHVVVDGTDETVDGIAELHFRTIGDFSDRFYGTADGPNAIGADVATFAGRFADTYLTTRQDRT